MRMRIQASNEKAQAPIPAGTDAGVAVYDAELRLLDAGGPAIMAGKVHRTILPCGGIVMTFVAHGATGAGKDGPLPLPPRSGGLAGWQMRRVQALIDESLGQAVSLSKLSGAVGLSRSHFCQAFKHSFGMPPYRWVQMRRIERAKELLCKPDRRSLTEIALELGFASSSHFSTAFRNGTGMTPREFRRMC